MPVIQVQENLRSLRFYQFYNEKIQIACCGENYNFFREFLIHRLNENMSSE